MIWYFICTFIFVAVGLLIIWLFVKFTGKHKPSRSEVLIEKAYEAVRDMEDYYDLYPEEQRERNLKILKGIAVNLAKLDREVIKEIPTKEGFDKDYIDSCIARAADAGTGEGVDADKNLDEIKDYI